MTMTQTLGELVADQPQVAPVLDRLGLDYCCHGDRTLAQASTAAGVDLETVLAELRAAAPVPGVDNSWTELDAAALADQIESTHHAYLHAELPELDVLAAKVQSVHGERHPELAEVNRLFQALRADLEPHLAKEELILFPAIRARAAVEGPVRVMLQEHDAAGDLLSALRTVTGGYAVPDDGCASYRSLYERLEALELDVHLHIHKENHRLFPLALSGGRGEPSPSSP